MQNYKKKQYQQKKSSYSLSFISTILLCSPRLGGELGGVEHLDGGGLKGEGEAHEVAYAMETLMAGSSGGDVQKIVIIGGGIVSKQKASPET